MRKEKLYLLKTQKGDICIRWNNANPKCFDRLHAIEHVSMDIGEHRATFRISRDADSPMDTVFLCLATIIREAMIHNALSFTINSHVPEAFTDIEYPWKPQWFDRGMLHETEIRLKQQYIFEYLATGMIKNINLYDFIDPDCQMMQWQIRRDYELLGNYRNIDGISEFSVCTMERTPAGIISLMNLNGELVYESKNEAGVLEHLSSWQQEHEIRLLIFKDFVPSQYLSWNARILLNDGAQIYTGSVVEEPQLKELFQALNMGAPKGLLS